MLSRLELAHTPHDLSIYVGLFVEVQNADFLRQQLLGGNADFEFAFIDARLVCCSGGLALNFSLIHK